MASLSTQPQTYRAILQGTQITWLDIPPDLPPGTEISVAIAQPTAQPSRGQAMATALEKLAQLTVLEEIDPVAWQQEIRQDRTLPGRE